MRPRPLHQSSRATNACTHTRTVFTAPAVSMGHEKRKGKEVVVEKSVRKRTRAEKEAERAELVAKAAEEQASGHALSFRIREQPNRGRVGRATRATAYQIERDSSEVEPSAESEGQSSPTPRWSGRSRQSSEGGSPPATEHRTRPRTRGGHQPQEPRRSTAAAAAARRVEALEAERTVFRMDTVVHLEPGVLLDAREQSRPWHRIL